MRTILFVLLLAAALFGQGYEVANGDTIVIGWFMEAMDGVTKFKVTFTDTVRDGYSYYFPVTDWASVWSGASAAIQTLPSYRFSVPPGHYFLVVVSQKEAVDSTPSDPIHLWVKPRSGDPYQPVNVYLLIRRAQ